MFKASGKQHMPKLKAKSHTLHAMEKRIVLNLAEKGEQTIYRLRMNMNHADYKNTYQATHRLSEKGLVKNTPPNKWWLTKEGMLEALLLGANQKKLIENSEAMKNKGDFALTVALADYLKDAPQSVKSYLREIIAVTKSISSEIDLKREATQREKETFSKFLDDVVAKHPDMKEFFDAYFKMRETIKGKES